MTTDPFADAAYAEAKRVFSDGVNRTYNITMKEARGGFIAGARWARTHLAEQEPTDAEVDAAAREIWGGGWDTTLPEIRDEYRERALSALRAARRDEEKRDG